jgi:hypothetical protein
MVNKVEQDPHHSHRKNLREKERGAEKTLPPQPARKKRGKQQRQSNRDRGQRKQHLGVVFECVQEQIVLSQPGKVVEAIKGNIRRNPAPASESDDDRAGIG